MTSRGRAPGALPTFLIAGAMKAGTTSLAQLLTRHPDIGMASAKELHYFDRPEMPALDWYSSRFAHVADRKARFEATPNYIYVPHAVERIARDLPASVRFVVVLRDPVDRAYSQYWHGRRVGAIDVTFEDALRLEPFRLGEGPQAWWSLVDRGRYVGQLRRFAGRVGRERLLVLLFEELVADPAAVADQVAAFVGVAPLEQAWGAVPHEHRARRSVVPAAIIAAIRRSRLARRALPGRVYFGLDQLLSVPFSPPPMDPATRAALAHRFRADNEALAEWLGCDLRGWTR